ncbi:MAG: hypothetical protein H0X14_06120 [Acidobacteria bacterium]|nr:hypothetical protein [Acidobacteriota bacterium]
MSIRNFTGWLLVALSVGMAVHSVWESIFTDNQMGYFAILLGMSMFITGALLTRRSTPREAAPITPTMRETFVPTALPASRSRSVSDWAQQSGSARKSNKKTHEDGA